MEKILMKGNDAFAEAAVRAGCNFFGGYPITPSSEILEYLSGRMEEEGRQFVQAESEVAAISMVYGAAASGARALTASSGPGISLKQEGISYIAAAGLPTVIIDIQRYGAGLGLISPGQSSYLQATKGGAHGDYKLLVYAPASVQEMVDLTSVSFEKAEEYMNPVLMLSDGALGQMMEAVVLPEMKEHKLNDTWALKGKGTGKSKVVNSTIYSDPINYEQNLRDKYEKMEKDEVRYEEFMVEDADIVLVAYGISSRVCKETVRAARKNGQKVGLFRPITVWPFPNEELFELAKTAKAFLTVEMNTLGQMVEDVKLAVCGEAPVYLEATGRTSPRVANILNHIDKITKEVL